MILEAFSQVLQLPENRDRAPEDVLDEWLWEILSAQPETNDMVGASIHAEIMPTFWNGDLAFQGRSMSGRRLLKSLQSYCKSYEHWQFAKWIHHIKASDFCVG